MSFPRYPAYKDGGVEWLGDVPEHWGLVRLKRNGTIRYGIGEPPSYHDSGTPLIRATNVDGGRIHAAGMVFVNASDIPPGRAVWLDEGDIIVVRSGAYTGDSALVRHEHLPSLAGFDMVFKPRGCLPVFVQYALLSTYLKNAQIDLEKLRAAQPHLNAEELGACLLVRPPLEEQAAIAAFLDGETAKIDALVAEQEKLIALLREKRQAVISHAVTKGLDLNVPMKDSGVEWLGEVPAHWDVGALRWKARCSSGLGISSELVESEFDVDHPIPVIGGNGLMGFTRDATIEEVVLSVGRVGALCGNVHIVPPPSWITDNAVVLRPDLAVLRTSYIAAVLRARNLNDTASKTAQPLITGTQILDQRVPIPSLQEQDEIVMFLEIESAKFDQLGNV